jgi:hypothetical protein
MNQKQSVKNKEEIKKNIDVVLKELHTIRDKEFIDLKGLLKRREYFSGLNVDYFEVDSEEYLESAQTNDKIFKKESSLEDIEIAIKIVENICKIKNQV